MIIRQLARGETAGYAAYELARYVKLICGEDSETVCEKGNGGITLECMNDAEIVLSGVKDKTIDDAYMINIDGLCGYIKGSNERSILYGVYAFLKKTGCRFIRPGKDGDYIPQKPLADFKVCFSEKAHSRFRCECIEGSVRYETIRDHIYWLPKAGYNGYMLQGTSPYLWYDRWYSHTGNPYMKKAPLTNAQADEMTVKLEHDIKRAGLSLHSVGHDYMAPAFGLFADVSEEDIDKKGIRKYLALVNGERKIMHGGIRHTNFCYSDPYLREKIIDYLVKYMKEKPYVDYMQLWFADNRNNFCECENCRKNTISDIYVEILNSLDAAFEKNNISAKIVFILYNDTCWAPLKERFNNPGRFVMMTAVRQNFIDGYSKYDPDIKVPEHLHNNYNVPPNHFPITMGFLRDWKKVFDGNSFFFDYHLYSDHLTDPGYCQIASRLCRDIKLLDAFGAEGLMNCCTYRKQMPTSYPAYLCGEMLFNPAKSEKDVREDYFNTCFGDEGQKVFEYLNRLSELFAPDLLRDTGISAADEMFDDPNVKINLPWMNNKKAFESFGKIGATVDAFLPLAQKRFAQTDGFYKKAWETLIIHAEIVKRLADALLSGAGGDIITAQQKCRELIDYLALNEESYMPELDFLLYLRRLRMMFGIANSIFAPIE